MNYLLKSGILLAACLLLIPGVNAQSDLLVYQSSSGKNVRVTNAKSWKKKRESIIKGIEAVTGPLPDHQSLAVPVPVFRDSVDNGVFTRYTVNLQSYQDEVVPIFLYIPNGLPKNTKVPAVLALHGTGAKGKFLADSSSAGTNRATATELAYRGYIVIAPDYPSFGELSKHDFSKDRFESGMMQAVFNNMRCIDYLVSRSDVDPASIGTIGHSLGGHTAMFLGAFDRRVKIVVASCGWTPFEYYDAGKEVTERYGAKMGPWAQDRYMPRIRTHYGLDPTKMPFNLDEVVAAIAPRHFFSNSPLQDANFNVEGVRVGEKRARQVYELLGVPDRLEIHYPEAAHDFPVETRRLAYEKMDSVLKKKQR